ncbi:cell division topological specificity factor MinE [bacterium SCSIO 12696]|nr:cell division topological specificity factor MinE [bacterium SCSIO 12696]
MSIFSYFRTQKKTSSASLAKERLQIIVAHERGKRNQPDYLEAMQKEIVKVIRKYVSIDSDQVSVNLDNNDDCSVLELNVTLPS